MVPEKMSFSNLSCEKFIEILSSKSPVPGGGGASALVGAVGVALGNMVANLTAGKKKYAGIQNDIIRIKQQADILQSDLLSFIQRDAEVFEPLARAYSMPKDTEDEKKEKETVLEAALKECSLVPIEMMQKCCEAIEMHKELAQIGTAIAISDVGVGAVMCKAALEGAALNVFINTKLMKDRSFAKELNLKVNIMLEKYLPMADNIYNSVYENLILR